MATSSISAQMPSAGTSDGPDSRSPASRWGSLHISEVRCSFTLQACVSAGAVCCLPGFNDFAALLKILVPHSQLPHTTPTSPLITIPKIITMAVPPDNSPASNAGGGRLAPKALDSTISCSPATPSIESLREVGNFAAVDAPPLTDTLIFSQSIAAAEDSTHDGLQVAKSLATDPAEPLEEASNIDSPSSGLSAPPALQSDCLFLNKVPAELRNEIYELAFTSSDDDEVEIDLSNFGPPRRPSLLIKGEVELSKAHPPDSALLSTCQQIQSEATQLYKRVSHKYWTDTHFVIVNMKPIGLTARLEIQSLKQDLWGVQNPRLKPENVDRIRHIRIFFRDFCNTDRLWISTYLPESGIWLWVCFNGTRANPLQSKYLVLRAYDRRVFPYEYNWAVYYGESDAETALQKWNLKKPFHVELGAQVFLHWI